MNRIGGLPMTHITRPTWATARTVVSLLVFAGALGTNGCARTIAKLSPAPGATVVPGPGNGARAIVNDVSVTARSEAWQWNPSNLKTRATPILLDLQNDGDRSIAVRYNHVFLS